MKAIKVFLIFLFYHIPNDYCVNNISFLLRRIPINSHYYNNVCYIQFVIFRDNMQELMYK